MSTIPFRETIPGKFEQRTRKFFRDLFPTPQENKAAIPYEALPEEIEIQRSNAQQETGFIPVEGTITFKDLYFTVQMSIATNNLMASLGRTSHQDQEIMRFRGIKDARNMVSAHNGRHQIIIIDDHQALAAHKADMKQAARVISHVAKTADGNGLELYRASPSVKNPRICKTSFQVEEAILEMHSVGGMCNMVHCLKKVLDNVLVGNSVKPTSIYIYTDGVWNTDASDVAKVILEAIDYLRKYDQPSSTLLFQFIQFGNSVKATQQLLSLKDRCKQQLGGIFLNIIDIKHCEGHIPDIIMGSIPR
ncbi:unnamed protein product [Fusarium venenatum]|uniref:VWFA domain-containing protein n=1 Tax=Fusarium venenatum TaxID=56646 RepID=A0A2L2THV7_9HYPO|nr:uncharacterized protein FVRRES_10631 [Fusarium venenatum]CEI70554.1 unnamed protein product [Fusarium venenatum]